MTDPCLEVAVRFLNDNFAPWEFAGEEPCAIALAALLRDTAAAAFAEHECPECPDCTVDIQP